MALRSPARSPSFSRFLYAIPLALALGSAACTQTPELVLEHLKRGDAALAAGKYTVALAAYNHARELAPQDANVQKALMKVRVHLVAEQPARLGGNELDDARYEAQLLLDTDKPREAVYLTALGNIQAKAGDVDGAKAKIADALKVDPNSAIAHAALGQVLIGTRDGVGAAKSEFEAALKGRPDYTAALLGLGQIKLAEGDAAGAAEKLEAVLKTGDDFTARMLLGQVKVQQQKPAEAIEHFRRAVQLDPKSADALNSLGQAFLSAGKPEEAERALRASLQLRQDGSASMALGFALNQQKKSEQALGVFNQLLAQDPTAAPALFGAGVANEGLGRKGDAVEHYKRLLALPAEGGQRQLVTGLQHDAQGRLSALTAEAAPAASATPSAGPAAGPAPRK